MEKGEKSWPQNYMELTVEDTVKIMRMNPNGPNTTYTKMNVTQALVANLVEGYKYPHKEGSKYPDYFYWGSLPAKAALYELGMRDLTGKGDWTTGKTYARTSYDPKDSVDGLPVLRENGDAWGPKILFGDMTGRYTPPYIPKADFFLPVKINNMRKERFAVMPWTGTTGDKFNVDGQKLVTLEFERANNDNNGQYYLKGGRMEYVRYSFDSTNYEMIFTPFGYGTDTTMDHNIRVQVIDNRHIKIIDNNPISWAGERYYNFNGVLVPYDTATPVGVNERPEILTPAISVYPNPIMDGVMNIKLDKPVLNDVKLYLYTPLGQKVEEIPIRAGEQEGHIYLEGLPTGTYWVVEGRYNLPVVIINK
jgi:hypothetical protein